MIQKALGFLFLFGIVPLCAGLLWTGGKREKERRIDFVYLAGFLTQLAVFQVIAVPVMIWNVYGMALLVNLTTAALAILSAAGVGYAVWKRRQTPAGAEDSGRLDAKADAGAPRTADVENGVRNRQCPAAGVWDAVKKMPGSLSLECKLFWLLVLAAVAFQMYMAFAYASFDGDDSYYVVQSVLADQTGVLNRIRPYTGLSTDLDIRHALAALPLWIAYVARMTGIHATIVAHSLLPLVLIPLTYLVYFEIGRKLLGARNVRLPIFMLLVNIMQIWGNASIYTNATFFLTRTWQGKSILANLVLLVQIWLLLELFEEKREGRDARYWGLLAVNNVAAAMMTSMGAFLAGMFLGIAGLAAAVRQRKPSVFLKAAVCCVPNVIYLLMLLVMG